LLPLLYGILDLLVAGFGATTATATTTLVAGIAGFLVSFISLSLFSPSLFSPSLSAYFI